MSVVIMICFARSGGTVLNQCLGSLPNVVILSELNPLGGGGGQGAPRTVRAQAQDWYQIELESDEFAEGILELEEICRRENRHLIVRDWSFVNFAPWRLNDWDPPNRLLTLEALRGKCKLVPFAFVRDSIDVWISRGVPVERFFPSYLRYAKTILKGDLPIYKYETFCRTPGELIHDICEYAGLEYSDSWKNYESFTTVNGDVQIPGGSRGMKQGKIKLLPRRRIPYEQIVAVNRSFEMIEANSLLGYPTDYYDNTWKENAWHRRCKFRLKNIVRHILKKRSL